MRDVLWTSLVASLQSGQCVLVVGPDIPALAGQGAAAPGGEAESVRDAFCRYLATQLREEQQQVTESALFAIAQQYQDNPAFSTVNLKNVAAQFFRTSEYRPSSLHAALAAFPFSLVLTTCHDHLVAQALQAAGKNPQRNSYHFAGEPRDNEELPATLTPEAPVVYHLFGEFSDPNNLVLTENDLLDFIIHVISGRPKLPDSLKSALRNKTFLFVGFGIKHWYIRVLLKLLIRTLELGGGSIALEALGGLDEREREQTVLFYKRGTRIEVVDVDLESFLGQLRERFERAGGFLGQKAGAGKRAQVFISYERSDGQLAEKLYHALPRESFEAWMDTQLLEAGEDWNQRIEDRIYSSDFFIVLNSANLAAKQVGYVNKEILLALDRQKYFQPGVKFVIPAAVEGAAPEGGRSDLKEFQQVRLRLERFDEDVGELVRTMTRDFQLRSRR